MNLRLQALLAIVAFVISVLFVLMPSSPHLMALFIFFAQPLFLIVAVMFLGRVFKELNASIVAIMFLRRLMPGPPDLLLSNRGQRINSRRVPCWDVAGKKRHGTQQTRNGQIYFGIARSYLEQNGFKQARNGNGGRQAGGETDPYVHQSLAENEPEDRSGARAQGHPQTDLV